MSSGTAVDANLPSLPQNVDNETDAPEHVIHTRDFRLLPIPRHLRYDSTRPAHAGTLLNVALGVGCTFVVANLYYCQPLLIEMSKSFEVTYDEVSTIPTLVQAGYATGLLLISPLGDLVRRRPLILLLVLVSGSLTIGLSTTHSLRAFEALNFLVGMTSVVPSILIALAADLAPAARRASAVSIVLAGLLFGILVARVISGIIANFVTWRAVYWMSIGMQFSILAGAYFCLPDTPAKNPQMSYLQILGTMAKYCVTEPLLVQSSLILFGANVTFSNLWVTLTFLLGGPPYHFSTLEIGIFGLIGMFGVAVSPLAGRFIDRVLPWFASLIAILGSMVFQAIEVGAGGVNIAAVVLAVFGLDAFQQTNQVAMSANVFSIDPAARARLNAVLIISVFMGQVVGTSVGTTIFVKSGWRAAAGFSLGMMGFQLVLLFLRGPHCPRHTWFGYEGGFEARRSVVEARKRQAEEAQEEKTEEAKTEEVTP